jgi:acyl-CoA thioesterase I
MKKLLYFLITFFYLSNFAFVSAQMTQIRVACIGNSITNGGNNNQAYPQQLGQKLGSHYLVKNYGIGGTTMLKKGDLPYWNQSVFWDAFDFDPHIIIICLGTNDSKPQNWIYKDDFFSNYLDFIRHFRLENRKPQIYICFPTPVFEDGFGITNSIIHDQIIPLIDSVRKVSHTLLINFNEKFAANSNLFTDGIHPNAEGYAKMADIVKDSILNSPSGKTRYFNSIKNTFEKDESLTLYWETSNGSVVSLDGNSVNEIDSLVVNPNGTTTYTLISKGILSDTNYVTVQYLPPGRIKSFTADPPALDIGSGDSSRLNWSATQGSILKLNNLMVEKTGTMYVSPASTTLYTLVASGNEFDTAYVTVKVIDSDKINRALNHSVKVSSTARGFNPASAVDGDTTTSWVSESANTQWISIDLGRSIEINRVVIHWGSIYGSLFHIQILTEDGLSKTIYSTSTGKGGVSDISGLSHIGQAIRLLCINKNNLDSGYIVKEIEIYGKLKSQTSVKENHSQLIKEFKLGQNFPNPFNPSTVISYQLTVNSKIILKVFNSLGEEIKTLVNEYQSAGIHSSLFTINSSLPSGIYFYQLRADNFVQTNKMLLLK